MEWSCGVECSKGDLVKIHVTSLNRTIWWFDDEWRMLFLTLYDIPLQLYHFITYPGFKLHQGYWVWGNQACFNSMVAMISALLMDVFLFNTAWTNIFFFLKWLKAKTKQKQKTEVHVEFTWQYFHGYCPNDRELLKIGHWMRNHLK